MKKFFIILAIFIILLITITPYPTKRNHLEVHVIDVGQGDSTLIITPENKTILIDAGEEEYARNVIRYIKLQRIKNIDYIICTHYDKDHIGGIDKVIEEIKTDHVLFPPKEFYNKEYLEIKSICKKNSTPISFIKSGSSIKIDRSSRMDIIAPIEITDDTNKNSVVSFFTHKNNKLLFTGDTDKDIEHAILNKYQLRNVNFLKVGHHGSKTSSSEEFISTIRPEVSSISCGYKNRFGHPHQSTLDTLGKYGSRVFRTDKNGDMVFFFEKDRIYTKKKYQ